MSDTDDLEEDDEGNDSILTDRQLKVLLLRSEGYSQQDIADMIGTSRPNISILEKRAHQNIKKAERTLHQCMMINAPISLKVEAGTDIFELPKMVFRAADIKGIKLPVTSIDIIVQLSQISPPLYKDRALKKNVQTFVTKDGKVLVETEE